MALMRSLTMALACGVLRSSAVFGSSAAIASVVAPLVTATTLPFRVQHGRSKSGSFERADEPRGFAQFEGIAPQRRHINLTPFAIISFVAQILSEHNKLLKTHKDFKSCQAFSLRLLVFSSQVEGYPSYPQIACPQHFSRFREHSKSRSIMGIRRTARALAGYARRLGV